MPRSSMSRRVVGDPAVQVAAARVAAHPDALGAGHDGQHRLVAVVGHPPGEGPAHTPAVCTLPVCPARGHFMERGPAGGYLGNGQHDVSWLASQHSPYSDHHPARSTGGAEELGIAVQLRIPHTRDAHR
jgi:hypothetical protein